MGNGASFVGDNLTPIVNRGDFFAKKGLKLSYLKTLIRSIPEEELKISNTTEVCEKYIKPLTGRFQCSFCELQECIDASVVGDATVFISHAWKYLLWEVIEALVDYFRESPDVIVWFDLVSNNQNLAPNRTFDWWCNTFKTAISEFGQTVMVFAPWNNPIPLQRGWCIWELFCTIETGCKFDIAMSTNNRKRFIDDVETDPTEVINAMLGTIDCEKSECFSPTDHQMIHDCIRSSVGFVTLNSKIFDVLRDWVIHQSEKEWENRKIEFGENHPQTLLIMNNLGKLYRNQGKYQQAETMYQQCLEKRQLILGKDHVDTLRTANGLGEVYRAQTKYSEAEILFLDCLTKSREILGSNHPDTLLVINNMGLLYLWVENYKGAEALLQECYDRRLELYGDSHPFTLKSLNHLGELYRYQEKWEPSESYHLQTLIKRKETLGENHPDTLTSIYNLSELYRQSQKYQLAEQFYQECIEKRIAILGVDHPFTITTQYGLGLLYLQQEQWKTAETILRDCLEKFQRLLGEDHPDTIAAKQALDRCQQISIS